MAAIADAVRSRHPRPPCSRTSALATVTGNEFEELGANATALGRILGRVFEDRFQVSTAYHR